MRNVSVSGVMRVSNMQTSDAALRRSASEHRKHQDACRWRKPISMSSYAPEVITLCTSQASRDIVRHR